MYMIQLSSVRLSIQEQTWYRRWQSLRSSADHGGGRVPSFLRLLVLPELWMEASTRLDPLESLEAGLNVRLSLVPGGRYALDRFFRRLNSSASLVDR